MFKISPGELPELKPYVFRWNAKHKIRAHIEMHGYAVVKIMDSNEASSTLKEFETWIEGLDKRIDLHDIHGGLSHELYPDNILGIFKSYGIGQAGFMNKMRNNRKLKSVFTSFWNCKESDLITSFDGACYVPHKFSNETFNLWPHRDQSPYVNGLTTIQGSINLIDNSGKYDGGFVLWPKTHKTENWDEFIGDKNKTTFHPPNFFEMKSAVNGIHKSGAYRMVVPPGALVLWDSRMIHCNCPPMNKKNANNRSVLFVCMGNISDINDNKHLMRLLEFRKKCIKNNRTTPHHPFGILVNDDVIKYSKSLIKIRKSY
jgi:hypothetical protein